ncbi:MAG TPA: hypothetical protein VFX03_04280 [Thermomicrobiales bacterium]|nr:hypothetical protein [Thermomicrobiales bacterium]
MDAEFASALAQWHDFFAAVAGVSATLVGLLFVALALNPLIMSDHRPAGLRTWAGLTFHNFLMVLTVALLALTPEQSIVSFTVTLLVIGGLGVARVVSDARRTRTDPNPEWQRRSALIRFAAPLAGYLSCIWAGIGIWRGEPEDLNWLISFVFFLLFSAAGSCWDVLKAIGDHERADDREPADAAGAHR